MTGYVRKDTTNNIADGNVINAADLDAEFDGVQDAFNASTGHNHDGTSGEGAPITALGPTQDVTISAILLAPKTTNTVDIGSSSLRYKDLFLAGNGSIGGTLAVTGVATLTAQPILSSLTASRAVFTDGSKGLVSNAITGTGNVVMSASPTLTGTIDAAAATLSGNLTLSGGTANGVTYLNGSKVVTSGSALTFDGTGLGIGTGTIPAGRKLVIDSGNIRLSNDYQIEWGGSTVGLYGNGSTNSLSFFANTSEQMRLTSTGLGIGTSSPAYKLDVNGQARLGGSTGLVFGVGTAFAVGQAEIYSTSTTPMGLGTTGAAVLRLYTNSTLQATLDSSGNLGIGTSSPSEKLTVAGGNISIGAGYKLQYSSTAYITPENNVSGAEISTTGVITFLTGTGTPAERTRIDAGGKFLIGTTTNNFASRLVVFNDASYTIESQRTTTASEGHMAFVNANGAVGTIFTSGTTTAYNTSSDYRLKNSIAPMTGALAKVAQLKPVTYKWNADGSNGEGFIAHELAEVCPDAVTGEKDAVDAQGNPQYQGIDVSFLVATLTAAIKEQQAIIESLKARLDAANL